MCAGCGWTGVQLLCEWLWSFWPVVHWPSWLSHSYFRRNSWPSSSNVTASHCTAAITSVGRVCGRPLTAMSTAALSTSWSCSTESDQRGLRRGPVGLPLRSGRSDLSRIILKVFVPPSVRRVGADSALPSANAHPMASSSESIRACGMLGFVKTFAGLASPGT